MTLRQDEAEAGADVGHGRGISLIKPDKRPASGFQ